MKTLKQTLKHNRKGMFLIPKSVQQSIPIRCAWEDGIFQIGEMFSKTFQFSDINYAIADKEDQKSLFLKWCDVLNSFDAGIIAKITIHNRKMDKHTLEQSILIPTQKDGLNQYREEYNQMILEKATGSNSMVQDLYLTISVYKQDVDDARVYFSRIGAELGTYLNRLGSRCTELDASERLKIIHTFFRPGEECNEDFSLSQTMQKGHDFRDYICPDALEFFPDHFKMGDTFGRVVFLREYANYIADSMVTELCEMNRNLMFSMDIIPIPTDEAIKELEKISLGVETNAMNWQRRQNANNNFTSELPTDMKQQRNESNEFIEDLTVRDQRMLMTTVTLVHLADSKKQLDSDTDALLATIHKHSCEMGKATYQQLDALNTALPYGLLLIDAIRTLTTESTAVLLPFRAQEIMDKGGIYYGQNVISKNMIIVNRKNLLNGNSFVLGVSGSGKSFKVKEEIVNIMLASDDDIILLDPEREYSALVKALGGEIVRLAADSPNHISATDISREYGEGRNPISAKSEFLLSMCEQLMEGHLTPNQKSIIDRCTDRIYRNYVRKDCRGQPPTLQDFHEKLLEQEEPEAHDVALALELFTSGSLNTFAKPTNVNINNRLVCYDILDLGKPLMPIGMLVVLDSIWNRVTKNRAQNKNTFIVIDEIYLLFQYEYSANFLYGLWKRMRKYGAYCTGVTQNVGDLLESQTAKAMLANSEFLVMLNQSSSDRLDLARLLNISELQLSYITNVDGGSGLMKVGSSLVPFFDKFPRNTSLYQLMTTKPGETGMQRKKYIKN